MSPVLHEIESETNTNISINILKEKRDYVGNSKAQVMH